MLLGKDTTGLFHLLVVFAQNGRIRTFGLVAIARHHHRSHAHGRGISTRDNHRSVARGLVVVTVNDRSQRSVNLVGFSAHHASVTRVGIVLTEHQIVRTNPTTAFVQTLAARVFIVAHHQIAVSIGGRG